MRADIDNDLLKEVEEAARKGAAKGATAGSFWRGLKNILIGLVCGAIIMMLVVMGIHKKNFSDTFHALFVKDTPVEDHDYTIENHGFFGYTVADFEDAILGDAEELRKLEVYSVEVSDLSTITKAGFGKIKAFNKYQYVTFRGNAVYTVDLGTLQNGDVTLDEATKTVTLTVPDVVLEPINIPSENIEFSEVEKETVLAFGSFKLTPEEITNVQTEAKERMKERLKNDNAADNARTAAKHSIWEIFQPVVSRIAPDYTLNIEFAEVTDAEANVEVIIDGESGESGSEAAETAEEEVVDSSQAQG